MQKFTVRAATVVLLLAVGVANASVVPAPDQAISTHLAMNSAFAQVHRPSVRAAADRTSAVRASVDHGSLVNDGNSYAMLGAGLGIMAVMARRRWRNQR